MSALYFAEVLPHCPDELPTALIASRERLPQSEEEGRGSSRRAPRCARRDDAPHNGETYARALKRFFRVQPLEGENSFLA